MLTRITQLQNELKTLRPLNAGELQRLRDEFILENTYNSNAIEGNTLTLRETALVLQEGVTIANKPLRHHLDVIGYRDAFYYILELTSTPLELRDILAIHALVLMSDRDNKGRFRSVPVRILGSTHEPPQAWEIEPQLTQLLADYRQWLQELHIIEAVARFHLVFESIHPFIDGNGRTGRLLLNLELIKHGLLPVDIKYTDKVAYYDCFDAYHTQQGNIQPFANMLATYELNELSKHIAIIKGATP